MTLENTLLCLFSWDVLFAILIGSVLGIILGALPGFTGSMGIALLIPVTYSMEPIPALVMLMSIYTAGIYGGSITAVLIHTPGAPSSAATADDGYQLTLKGQGKQALGVTTVCSGFGGLLSGIALITIAPWLARVSLSFGPAEKFMVSIFGLTIIGSLCEGGVIKGLLVGAFGLALSCIGVDASTGFPRFMYGNDYLANGLSTIPVLIGLFSISQLFIMAENPPSSSKGIVDASIANLKGRTLLPWKKFRTLIWPSIRSTVIGILVGIMPGAGGDIASFMAVNVGKNSSKHPEEYGKGSYEAIACAEAANNAVSGGAMIPLLTLGIPGAPAAALLLGGFTIHGLEIGNRLFTANANITYPILSGFIAANFVLIVLGLVGAKWFAKVTKVPISILAPVIMVMATMGCYSVHRSMLDVWVAVIFGLIGYILIKHNMITSPIVLAIILGPMAEENLQSCLVLAGKYSSFLAFFLSSPIVLFMIGLCLISMFLPTIRGQFAKRKKAKTQS